MEIGQKVKYKDGFSSGEGTIRRIEIEGEYKDQILVEIGRKAHAYFDVNGDSKNPHICRYYHKDSVEYIENYYQIY